MRINYEIRSQLGFSNTGRLSGKKKGKVNTPCLMLPIMKHFSYLKKESSICKFLENRKHWIGNRVLDPVNIAEPIQSKVNNSTAKEHSSNETSELRTNIEKNIWCLQSREMQGIPLKGMENNFNQDQIIILTENYAHTTHYQYVDYESKALEVRLGLYQDILFNRYPDHKFILEFSFNPKNQANLDIVSDWIEKNRRNVLGIEISDMFSNLGNAREAISWLLRMKKNLPSNLLWIAGGKILPEFYALAIYCGFDVVDASYTISMGYRGLYATRDRSDWLRNIRYTPCSCPICSTISDKFPKRRDVLETRDFKNKMVQHNLFVAFSEVSVVRNRLKIGDLRTYVEKMVHNHPSAASFLRILDSECKKQILARYPISSSYPVYCVGCESYRRPEVQNFIQRVKKHVSPPKSFPFVVLLPCSAKKPYSHSRSHRSFQKSMKRAVKMFKGKIGWDDIHEVIVTSPLGVVPRELESVFPAQHYDIPVTGEWDTEEIEIASDCVASYLQKCVEVNIENPQPLRVIAHLPSGYRKACVKALKKLEMLLEDSFSPSVEVYFTMKEEDDFSASSNDALKLFENSLKKAFAESIEQQETQKNESESKEEEKTVKKALVAPLNRNEVFLHMLFDYQFGKGAGDVLIRLGTVFAHTRNPHHDEVYVYDGAGKLVVARVYKDNGLVKLTATGGQKLYNSGFEFNVLRLSEPSIRGTTVFRPILGSVDDAAHPEDEMIIVNSEDEFVGVGGLKLYAPDAMSCNYGATCNIRKKLS